MYRNALLQECDDGAAAKESLRTLGYHDLQAHPGRQRRDGVWKPLRRAHPSCGRGG